MNRIRKVRKFLKLGPVRIGAAIRLHEAVESLVMAHQLRRREYVPGP